MTTESSKSLLHPNTPVVDYQVHWYPPSVVEQLVGRSTYPTVERGAEGEYVLWLDEGVLDAVPDLVVVHPHLGGVLPYVAERISPLGGSKAQHPLEHYFKTRFYVDTAAGNPGALRLAVETYGIERVVFASDYPFYEMPAVRRWVEDALEPPAAHQIYANRVPGLRLPTAALSA